MGAWSESSQYRKSGRSGSSARAVPKAPSSQPAAVNSDTAVPATPAKGMFISNARAVPTFPIPSVPKQQMPRKDGGSGGGDQSNTGEAHQMSKAERDVPSVQPHPMQPQGMMHQGPSLNFTAQMGPQVPQIGNLGIGMSPQFAQQQAGKFCTPRRPVKITHPDTHEELRLGRRADTHMDGGSSGPRTHPNVPQSQPITSVPPPHSINYYSTSYNPNSLYFPGPTSVPLTSNQNNPSSPQPPRFSYPVSQSPQTVSFMNPSAQNSYTNKNSTLMHGIAEPSSLEHSRDVHNAISSASLATEDINAGLVSLQAAGSKDKPVLLDLNSRSKSTVAKGKKKRKEILQKAHAAGTTSDLYMAYKGPEGKKETDASSESLASTSSISSKQVLVDVKDDVVLSENGGQSKAEPDDWEDAADISTPKLDTTVDDGKLAHGELKHVGEDGNGVMAKKYSRDFILKFREQCTSLPEGFEYTSDIVEALRVSNVNASHESFPSPGRIIDRPSAGLVSLPAAGSKDKPVLELSRSNSTVAKEKKKRKKNLQKKRNSAGTTSDLDPEGKKETVASSSESLASTSSINSKQVLVDVKDDVVLSENGGQSKVLEPDDWEDATDISTPKLDTTVDDGKQAHGGLKHVGEYGNGVVAKKYSRDFLLKFREQCTS